MILVLLCLSILLATLLKMTEMEVRRLSERVEIIDQLVWTLILEDDDEMVYPIEPEQIQYPNSTDVPTHCPYHFDNVIGCPICKGVD
jgi:hypothetical protein